MLTTNNTEWVGYLCQLFTMHDSEKIMGEGVRKNAKAVGREESCEMFTCMHNMAVAHFNL